MTGLTGLTGMSSTSPDYVPGGAPFWTDGEFEVFEHPYKSDKFIAARVRGGQTYRGTLKGCADWIERNR